ncbi:MAG: hypothetical protein ABWX90_03545, partial [Candidatus Saccharimonadales bacterium]
MPLVRARLSVGVIIAAVAIVGGLASLVVGVRSTTVNAAHCNQNYYGVSYNQHGFFDGRCANVLNFPNTGTPYVSSTDGNADSVGYVIPRTSKDFSFGSEALAGVNNKMDFYNRLKYHYDVRGS